MKPTTRSPADASRLADGHARRVEFGDKMMDACMSAIDEAVESFMQMSHEDAAHGHADKAKEADPTREAAPPAARKVEEIPRAARPPRPAAPPDRNVAPPDRDTAPPQRAVLPPRRPDPAPAPSAAGLPPQEPEPDIRMIAPEKPARRPQPAAARQPPQFPQPPRQATQAPPPPQSRQTQPPPPRPRQATAEQRQEAPTIGPASRAEPQEKLDIPFVKTIDSDNGPIRVGDRRPVAGKDEPAAENGGGNGGGTAEKSGFHQRSAPVNFALSMQRAMATVRRNMAIVMVFTLAINVLLLAIPIYLFQISDRVLTSRSIDTLVMLTVAVIGAVLLQAFMDAIRRFILMRTAVELEVQLGSPILSAAARASLHGSGKDYQTLQDLQQLRAFLTSGTLISFLDAPLMPLFVVVVYFVHPHLGIIIMVCCAVLFSIAWLNQRFTHKQFAEANGFASRANFHLDSMTRNSQIINALAMIPEAVRMWGQETAGSLKAHVNAQDRNIVFSGVSKAARMVTQVALLGWGAHLSLSGELSGGMVIAASIISGRALAPIEGAIEGWNQFNRSSAAYGRIRQLLLSSPLNFTRLRLPNPEGRLDVERVLFVPPPQKKVILNGISFSLKKGESLAIIGNSGSGKTTLGKMLVGSIVPTSGNVRLDLMDLRNWDQRQFGESIGYVPQDVQLFPGTIKANISRMRDDVEDRQIFEAAVLADVHELIAGFPQGYETVVAADGAPLSGGQKQRIALARAFFGNPKFVVLDEPNSNLDTQGEAALAKALLHAKKNGITTVTITQRPALLQCVDKIMVLKDGTVAIFGERAEVLRVLSGGNRAPQNEKLTGA